LSRLLGLGPRLELKSGDGHGWDVNQNEVIGVLAAGADIGGSGLGFLKGKSRDFCFRFIFLDGRGGGKGGWIGSMHLGALLACLLMS
jgi:hypothetical protein